jgi:hypoxanthine phosphoribosyltransferase
MSLITLGEKTKLVKASTHFESLRTTVPKSIVNQLKLKEGDTLDWQLSVMDGKMVLIVDKVKDSGRK